MPPTYTSPPGLSAMADGWSTSLPPIYDENCNASPAGVTFATNPSNTPPPYCGRAALTSGKFVDVVVPATYAAPDASIVTAPMPSDPEPPR